MNDNGVLIGSAVYTFDVIKNVRVIFRAVFWFLRPFSSVSILLRYFSSDCDFAQPASIPCVMSRFCPYSRGWVCDEIAREDSRSTLFPISYLLRPGTRNMLAWVLASWSSIETDRGKEQLPLKTRTGVCDDGRESIPRED